MKKIFLFFSFIFLLVILSSFSDAADCVGTNVYSTIGRGRHDCFGFSAEDCELHYTFNDGPLGSDPSFTTYTWVQCNWDANRLECNGHGPVCTKPSTCETKSCTKDEDCRQAYCNGKKVVVPVCSDGCCIENKICTLNPPFGLPCVADCLPGIIDNCPEITQTKRFNDFCQPPALIPDLRLSEYQPKVNNIKDGVDINGVCKPDVCDEETCTCGDCVPNIAEPNIVTHCVKGICDAECDENDNAPAPGKPAGEDKCDIENTNGFGFCKLTYCGDGVVQSPDGRGVYEQCDEGASNGESWSSCTAECQSLCINADIKNLRSQCGEDTNNGAVDSAIPVDSAPCIGRGIVSCVQGTEYVSLSDSRTSAGKINPGNIMTMRIDLTGKNDIPGGIMPADVMFVMDKSDSMKEIFQGKQKIQWAKDALNSIYTIFKSSDAGKSFKLGLVTFNHDNQVNSFLDYTSKSSFGFSNFDACGCSWIAGGIKDGVFTKNLGSGLSCNDGNVKKAVVIATDGDENRDKYQSTWKFLADSKNLVSNNIAFYTIGIGVTSDMQNELEDVAYNWGNRKGAYFRVDDISQLSGIYTQIAQPFSSSKTADEIIIKIVFNSEFEYLSSTLIPSYVSNDKSTAEWRIDGIDKNQINSFNINVKSKNDATIGIKNMIDTANSFVKVYNKCGLEDKALNQLNVEITNQIILPEYPQCDESQRIMKINTQNKLGALWNGDDTNFPYDICYNVIYGKDYSPDEDEDVHIENNNFVVGLSSGKASFPNYGSENVFFGDLRCELQTSCREGYKCVVTISGENDANILPCGLPGSYNNKICCISGNFNDAYWTDNNDVRTTSAEIGETVKMVWESAGLNSGDNYVFEIKEWDYGLLDADEDIKTIRNVVSENGRVVAEWIITNEDFIRANEDEEAHFYFKINGKSMEDIGYSREDDLIVSGEIIPPEIWECENGGDFSSWISDSENIDTRNMEGSCDGASYGVSGDCCPTAVNSEGEGWTCSNVENYDYKICVAPEGIELPCDGIRTCSDYDEQEDCNNDMCNVGNIASRTIKKFPSECLPKLGGISVDEITKNRFTNLCVWKDEECKRNRGISWLYNNKEFWAMCYNTFDITKECGIEPNPDKMTIDILFESVEWDNNLPVGLDFTNVVDRDECGRIICGAGEQDLQCLGAVLKVPFLNWIGIILILGLLSLFYLKKFKH